MLRATHVNMTLTATLLYIISSGFFSIHCLYVSFYAIIQDWDHHKSFLTNYFKISLPFKHRGFTHTLLFVLLFILFINILGFSYNVYDWNYELLLSSFIEFFWTQKVNNSFLFVMLHGHLLGDLLTKKGIPYLYPIYKWNIWLGLFTTGEGQNGKISGEMYLNFWHTIANVYLFSYLAYNWADYSESFNNTIWNIVQSWWLNLILILVVLQMIFVFALFFNDMKRVSNYTKKLIKNTFKVLSLSFLVWLVWWIIVSLLTVLSIDLWIILKEITSGSVNIENLNNYVYISLAVWAFIFFLNMTKKYIVSMATSISYIINIFYIFLSMIMFWFALI